MFHYKMVEEPGGVPLVEFDREHEYVQGDCVGYAGEVYRVNLMTYIGVKANNLRRLEVFKTNDGVYVELVQRRTSRPEP
jgi:hypothetical protein